jgi:predicted RNA-binding protein with TRAM domain
MDQGPKPVEAGKEYDVEVTEISRRGDGVAKIQGFIIFVKGAKVGDKVKIKVESVGPRFATATALGGSVAKVEEGKAPSDASMTESV